MRSEREEREEIVEREVGEFRERGVLARERES